MMRKIFILFFILLLVSTTALNGSANKTVNDTVNKTVNETVESGLLLKLLNLTTLGVVVAILGMVTIVYLVLTDKSVSNKGTSKHNRITPTTSGRKLSVTVEDENNFIVQNASVALIDGNGKNTHFEYTGPSGQVLFTNVRSSEKTVQVSKKIGMDSLKVTKNIDPQQNQITVVLEKPILARFKIIDNETNQPLSGVLVRIKDEDGMTKNDKSDPMGIVNFNLKKGKIVLLIEHSNYLKFNKVHSTDKMEAGKVYSLPLSKKAGSVDVILDIQNADIEVSAINISTNAEIFETTDASGTAHFDNIPVGNYQIKIKSNVILKSDAQSCTIEENSKHICRLNVDYSYRINPEQTIKIQQIKGIIEDGYREVSSYDTCIQQYIRHIGQIPLELALDVADKQLYFVNSNVSPDKFVQYTLETAEIIGNEIATILRDKNNIDLFAEANGLPQIERVKLSSYQDSKFKNLVEQTANYYQSNYRDAGNKLYSIDESITQKSGELTIHPIADIWKTSKNLMGLCNSEIDENKKGIMLFILELMLINLEEMFVDEDVLKRLKLRVF